MNKLVQPSDINFVFKEVIEEGFKKNIVSILKAINEELLKPFDLKTTKLRPETRVVCVKNLFYSNYKDQKVYTLEINKIVKLEDNLSYYKNKEITKNLIELFEHKTDWENTFIDIGFCVNDSHTTDSRIKRTYNYKIMFKAQFPVEYYTKIQQSLIDHNEQVFTEIIKELSL